MGFFTSVGSLFATGAGVAKSVCNLAVGVLKTGKSIFSSTIGKIGIGALGVLALSKNLGRENSGVSSEKSSGFFGAIGATIQNVIAGGANLVQKFVGNASKAGEEIADQTGLKAAAETACENTEEWYATDAIHETASNETQIQSDEPQNVNETTVQETADIEYV